MDLMVMDTLYNTVSIIDQYQSFIWTDRYNQYGDFELYTSMNDSLLSYIKQDYYIINKTSEHVMIIEKIFINSDSEGGHNITISGRSLESILLRRIIWGQIIVHGRLQDVIETIFNDNIINPVDISRKINNFVFEKTDDPHINNIFIQNQYTGDNIYDIIQKICEEYDLGFKITLNNVNQFVFKFYYGKDRSYDQTTLPYVIFSPKFDNIINSNYIENKQALKTITLIAGAGEGINRVYSSVSTGYYTGLNRRELFTDARDISAEQDGEPIPIDTYKTLLEKRGIEKLSGCVLATSFEGQTETTIMFKYGEDFFNGDIVQIANEYGHEARARIIEIVISDNEEGTLLFPTFKIV